MNEKTLFHIHITPEQGAKYAILPGDPGRVEKIAAFIDEPRPLAQNREFTSYCGTLCGERVIILSTGIGGPSAAIALEELSRAGLTTAIRIGTCGGMQTEVESGDIVIATGAVRMEGTTREYAPIEYPAVATLEVANALVSSAAQQGFPYHTGVVQCKDSFFGQHEPEVMPVGYELQQKWEAWKRLGCLASEMESATLFIVAARLHARAGTCLLVVANQERERLGLYNPVIHDMDQAIRVGIEGVRNLIRQDQQTQK